MAFLLILFALFFAPFGAVGGSIGSSGSSGFGSSIAPRVHAAPVAKDPCLGTTAKARRRNWKRPMPKGCAPQLAPVRSPSQ